MYISDLGGIWGSFLTTAFSFDGSKIRSLTPTNQGCLGVPVTVKYRSIASCTCGLKSIDFKIHITRILEQE